MKVLAIWKTKFDNLMVSLNITNDNVEKVPHTFFISINDSIGTDEVPYFENKENVLVLFFDDVEEDIAVMVQGNVQFAKAFTFEQAKQVIEFIEKHKDKQSCIVHCSAGISRSGAIAEFVNDFFGGDYFEFKKANPRLYPNGHVLRTLKGANL